MKAIRIAAMVLGGYILLGVVLDGAIGYFQPESGQTAVLRSFDADGAAHDTVLGLLDDDGQLWVESGHWFRGWYNRLATRADVELIRGGKAEAYSAVPVDTPEALERVTRLMGKGQGAGYWVGRTMLLYAPIRPVRLDPRALAGP